MGPVSPNFHHPSGLQDSNSPKKVASLEVIFNCMESFTLAEHCMAGSQLGESTKKPAFFQPAQFVGRRASLVEPEQKWTASDRTGSR